MQNIAASSQTWTLDGTASTTGSPPFPGSASAAGIPSNYYIVIDGIMVTLTAAGAGDYTILVKADDGTALFSVGKTFLAAESDTFQLSFPKGFILPKVMVASQVGKRHQQTNAAYTSNAMFNVTGAPTLCVVIVHYRYVSMADCGY